MLLEVISTNLSEVAIVLCSVGILLLAVVIVSLIKLNHKLMDYITKDQQKDSNIITENQNYLSESVIEPKKALSMDDITDEDMMVAALVATIDYANEASGNVRLVSIKQIG